MRALYLALAILLTLTYTNGTPFNGAIIDGARYQNMTGNYKPIGFNETVTSRNECISALGYFWSMPDLDYILISLADDYPTDNISDFCHTFGYNPTDSYNIYDKTYPFGDDYLALFALSTIGQNVNVALPCGPSLCGLCRGTIACALALRCIYYNPYFIDIVTLVGVRPLTDKR